MRYKNACCTLNHNVIWSSDSFKENRLHYDGVDAMFGNETSRGDGSDFVRPVGNLSDTSSLFQLARENAWMKCVLEDIELKREGTHLLRCLDTVVLRGRYNILIRHSIYNIRM